MAPAPAVQLRLFGAPVLQAGDTATPLGAERPHQLLALLACRRTWVRRDELAEALYPQHPPAQARNNLRKVLLMATRVPGTEALERDGDRLRWLPDSDLARFEQACDAQRLEDAIALYLPPLLGGPMEGAFAGTTVEWLAVERARLHARWRTACAASLDAVAHDPAAQVALSLRILAVDPLDEPAVLTLARAQLTLGQAEVAAQALAAFRHRLGLEADAVPSAALQSLEREAQLQPASARVRTARVGAAFIGRRHELAAIAQRLNTPATRCLTLTGPGGIGKTATCRVAAAAWAAHSDRRVVWVPLDDLTDLAQVPARLAGRLGLALDGTREPWVQLAAALAGAPPLVVIDNAEHLALADVLAPLLAACPALQLLVSSRASLGVPDEQVMPLAGLPLPDDDERDAEVLRACDAVRLFEERALAVAPSFDLAPQAGAVIQLLQLVEGLPMAIELAAAWTRLLPVAQIVDELRNSVDLLDTATVRHERGLRASFEQSWRLLDAPEREALARLALLPGPFGAAMAQGVAQAPLRVLASLVDQSLLRAEGDGRFALHPLIRQCAAAKATDAATVEQAHRAFVAAWLSPPAGGPSRDTNALMQELDTELPHARAAWASAVAAGDAGALRALSPLTTYWQHRGLLAEGMQALANAARAVDAAVDSDPEARRAMCTVLASLAGMQYLSGRVQPAEDSARRLLALTQAGGDTKFQMRALNIAGLCLQHRSNFAEARPLFEQALELARAAGNDQSAAVYSANLADASGELGDLSGAQAGHREALALHRRADNPVGVAASLCALALVAQERGEAAAALAHLAEAQVLCRQHRLDGQLATVWLNEASVRVDQGEHVQAAQALERAWAGACEHQLPMVQTGVLLQQAHLHCEAGVHAAARAKLWEAWTIAERMEWQGARVECVVAFAEVLAAEGHVAEGCALVRWSLAQAGTWRRSRQQAKALLDRLQALPGASAAVPAIAPDTPIVQVLARVG